MRRVLNVGGNNKSIPLPPQYEGWEHVLLDVDPSGDPDVLCDARELGSLPASTYDAVYCSHNLEHYHRHEAPRVLAGFLHVLKEDGFAHIIVPDVGELMRIVVQHQLDVEDVLYECPMGPVRVCDVLYGFGPEIERSGNDFFAHRNGFTKRSLTSLLKRSGFSTVYSNTGNLEVAVVALRSKPSLEIIELFELQDQ